MGWKFKNYWKKNFICHHSVKKDHCLQQVCLSENLLLASHSSMMNILIHRKFVSAFNNNHASNNEIFFLCCCSCTNGKIASSCQLCDGYCYNGGTCRLDPETNVPVCLWVFYNVMDILWYSFRYPWNPCSLVLLCWGNTF